MPDLLVAGAGPAGLATAIGAARAGLEVVVLDPRAGEPIDKACGEGLMPPAVAALAELGVDPPGHALRGIRYVEGRWHAEARFRRGPGRGVRRTDLQAGLLAAARAAGVTVREGRVDEVDQDADGVTAGGLRARWLVAADGLHSPVRRSLGLDSPSALAPRWGLRRHHAVAPWTDLVEVHWAPGAEAYVTPVGPGLVGVAVLSGCKGSYDDQLAAFPELVARLTGPGATDVRGAGPLRQGARRRVAGRVLLVGDAAGYVDALTGEGIAVSLACAAGLVECLVREQPEDYEARWRSASRTYRVMTGGLLWARRQRLLRPAIVPLAAALPPVFGAAVHVMAR